MKNKYLTLFSSTFYLSSFTFGGGYVIIPLMKAKFVEELGWIEDNEMLDLIAIAQSAPGAVAINAAILIGFKIGKLPGALLAILGTVLPPIMIISIISLFYDQFRSNYHISLFLKAMQSGVVAIIFHTVSDLSLKLLKTRSPLIITLLAVCLVLKLFLGLSVTMIILGCALVGMLSSLVNLPKFKKEVNGNVD